MPILFYSKERALPYNTQLERLGESHLVEYAGDVAALVTANTVEQAQRTQKMMMRPVSK